MRREIMNELKFPFKFKHIDEPDIFTASLLFDDKVKVSWVEGHENHSVTYDISIVEHSIEAGYWKVVDENGKEQDPEVVIKQSDYDSLVDEINMLRELVAEITLETDYTALGQQASTYRALNEKMSNHQSYKQGDGWSTRESELLEQLDVLFEAYDNVVYTEKEQTFKPISEMTLEDWQQAMEEGWEFETRDGDVISAMTLSSISNSYPVICNNTLAYTIRGYFWDSGKEHDADIIKRVK
jgi:hypothetical protein